MSRGGDKPGWEPGRGKPTSKAGASVMSQGGNQGGGKPRPYNITQWGMKSRLSCHSEGSEEFPVQRARFWAWRRMIAIAFRMVGDGECLRLELTYA